MTDSVSNKVYRFDRAAGTFTSLAIYRALSAPNGIALGGQDRLLFVADDFGIIRVDLDRGASSDVNRGKSNTLAGVDGLYWRDGNLIAVQNGIGSPRIVSFRLSKDGTKVEETTVLENRTTLTKTPTTGALQRNKFYFIAKEGLKN